MPEVASVPVNATPTGWLYQPFASGSRPGLADTLGGVESYLMPMLALAEFPAASLQEPETLAPPSSGPEYVAEVHEAIPEVASVPAKATATGWLYQPFASGARPALALTFGAVPSYFRPRLAGAETLPALSVQVPV